MPVRWNQYRAIPSPVTESTASVLGSATGAGWPSRTPDWASPSASRDPNGSADIRPRNCTCAPSRAIVRAAL